MMNTIVLIIWNVENVLIGIESRCNMKEFVEKLIEKFEKEAFAIQLNQGIKHPSTHDMFLETFTVRQIEEIINQLAEEYNNGFCEWKLDGVYLMCQHKTELFVSCLEDEKHRYKYCPICGKKIKVVE